MPWTHEDWNTIDVAPSLRGPTFVEPHKRASYFRELFPEDYFYNKSLGDIEEEQEEQEENEENEEEEGRK